MEKRLVPKIEKFDCSNCERNVTFSYLLLELSVEEVGVVEIVLDKVTRYGKCKISETAKTPNYPVHDEIKECPIYMELTKRKWKGE